MTWDVEFEDEFESEFDGFADPVKTELLARAKVLAQFGPMLGRPNVDTLNGSEYANMKELRFNADDGVWRGQGGQGSETVLQGSDPSRRQALQNASGAREKMKRYCYGHHTTTEN